MNGTVIENGERQTFLTGNEGYGFCRSTEDWRMVEWGTAKGFTPFYRCDVFVPKETMEPVNLDLG